MFGRICSFRLAWVDVPASAPGTSGDPARAALKKGGYPWYDSASDALRAVVPPEPPPPRSLDPNLSSSSFQWNLGSLVYILLAILIVLAIAAIVWAVKKYVPGEAPKIKLPEAPGRAVRTIGPLPVGLAVEEEDPWAAAEKARSAGDYGRAILYLFAYELYALDEAGRIRLAPGKTCRQLVRDLDDSQTRGWVEPALGLFEAAYYGRRPPSQAAFEQARRGAVELRRRLSAERTRS